MGESILDKVRLYSLHIENYDLPSSDDIHAGKKSPVIERGKARKYSPDKEGGGIVQGRGRSRGRSGGIQGRKKEDSAFISEEGTKKPPSFVFR